MESLRGDDQLNVPVVSLALRCMWGNTYEPFSFVDLNSAFLSDILLPSNLANAFTRLVKQLDMLKAFIFISECHDYLPNLVWVELALIRLLVIQVIALFVNKVHVADWRMIVWAQTNNWVVISWLGWPDQIVLFVAWIKNFWSTNSLDFFYFKCLFF